MKEPNVWTDADQAELDVLLWELLSALEEHRARCPRCQAEKRSGWPCPRVTEAVEAMLDWRHGRALRSRATALRRLQLGDELAEIRQEIARLGRARAAA